MIPRLPNNHDVITRALRQYNAKAEPNYPQYLCFFLRIHLKQSKYYDRLTDDLLVTKTLQVLSGDYDPLEPIDFFLYPQGGHSSRHLAVDVLTTDFYRIQKYYPDDKRSMTTLRDTDERGMVLLLHDKETDTYTQVNANPFETLWVEKSVALYLLDYLNENAFVTKLDLKHQSNILFLLECGIILKNFDKRAKAIKIDPNYVPKPYIPPEPQPPKPLPESTVEYVDDLDEPNDDLDDSDSPIEVVTDELLELLDAAEAFEGLEDFDELNPEL